MTMHACLIGDCVSLFVCASDVALVNNRKHELFCLMKQKLASHSQVTIITALLVMLHECNRNRKRGLGGI